MGRKRRAATAGRRSRITGGWAHGSVEEIEAIIKNGTPGGMPAFPLPENQIRQLASYVHSLNATAFELKPDGDVAAGERFFFGQGKCGSCHAANGRGNRYQWSRSFECRAANDVGGDGDSSYAILRRALPRVMAWRM